eukprot:TRINITY_DN34620_c0_g1_i1.p1 TRINITY_DN34620_c0_g1~~TRINITY_DN34620_c0_g1_i1.p1  ORF type:complete len:339 (-),score=67.19 TRINITY_DN34620_c0_g1_i1:167-1183(-)
MSRELIIVRAFARHLCRDVGSAGVYVFFFFFFQAEDGIRDVERSRGLGDVYKRQVSTQSTWGNKKRKMKIEDTVLTKITYLSETKMLRLGSGSYMELNCALPAMFPNLDYDEVDLACLVPGSEKSLIIKNEDDWIRLLQEMLPKLGLGRMEFEIKKREVIRAQPVPEPSPKLPEFSTIVQEEIEHKREEIRKAAEQMIAQGVSQVLSLNTDPSLVHENVICSICQTCPIVGVRYKCTICDNFNLCESCEEQELHSDHALLKIAKKREEVNPNLHESSASFEVSEEDIKNVKKLLKEMPPVPQSVSVRSPMHSGLLYNQKGYKRQKVKQFLKGLSLIHI